MISFTSVFSEIVLTCYRSRATAQIFLSVFSSEKVFFSFFLFNEWLGGCILKYLFQNTKIIITLQGPRKTFLIYFQKLLPRKQLLRLLSKIITEWSSIQKYRKLECVRHLVEHRKKKKQNKRSGGI